MLSKEQAREQILEYVRENPGCETKNVVTEFMADCDRIIITLDQLVMEQFIEKTMAGEYYFIDYMVRKIHKGDEPNEIVEKFLTRAEAKQLVQDDIDINPDADDYMLVFDKM